MLLLPEKYNPFAEAENLINKAVRFTDKKYDEINFAVLSSLVFIACTKKGAQGEGELYIGDCGGATQTAKTSLKAGPIKFAEGDISCPVLHYIEKPVLRVFFSQSGKAKYIDFNVLTFTFEEEAHELKILGEPYYMYKLSHGKPMMTEKSANGAMLCELNKECNEAIWEKPVDTEILEIGTDSANGYFGFTSDGRIIHTSDGTEWTTEAEGYDTLNKPSFARLYRLYYIAYNTENGVKIDVSKNCKEWETLIQFGSDTDIDGISFYEWDGIIYYCALLDGKPIYSRLR